VPKSVNVALVLLALGLLMMFSYLLVQITDLLAHEELAAPVPSMTMSASTSTTTPASQSSIVTTPVPTWTPTSLPTPYPTSTPSPTWTLTPTLTPTALPLRRPTAVSVVITTTPEISTTYPIPTAVPRYPISTEAVTIVLLGSDRRPEWSHWNTDAIHYVVVYPNVPSVTVLSIPRDLYVYIPEFRMSRINVADMYGTIYNYDGGGLGLLNQTLLYNLGITADYYVKINFDGLTTLIDSLGGIDVPVHCYIEDYWPYADENGEFHKISVEPGLQHMNGDLALWYSRTRKTTSVFAREARQQQVLEAIWRTAKQANLLSSILYQQYGSLVETDLDIANILLLGQLASRIDATQVRFLNIGRQEVVPFVTEQGGNVYLPTWDAIAPIVDRTLLPPAASRATRAAVQVEIWNGTEYAHWDILAADTLYHEGYTPILGIADHHSYARTQIQVFGDSVKGSGLSSLQELFGVPDADVIPVSEDQGPIRLRLILGQNYNPCR